jgi:hypothetical protein
MYLYKCCPVSERPCGFAIGIARFSRWNTRCQQIQKFMPLKSSSAEQRRALTKPIVFVFSVATVNFHQRVASRGGIARGCSSSSACRGCVRLFITAPGVVICSGILPHRHRPVHGLAKACYIRVAGHYATLPSCTAADSLLRAAVYRAGTDPSFNCGRSQKSCG